MCYSYVNDLYTHSNSPVVLIIDIFVMWKLM